MAKKTKDFSLSFEERLEQALIPNWDEPYKLPENWCWVYLTKGFAQCLDSFRKPVNASERSEMQGDIPYYGATGQVGWINDYLTNEHLVLLGEDGAPFLDYKKNKAYIIKGKAWINNHAHILKSFYGEDSNLYLMHYLNMFNYHGYVNGSTRLKLTQESMNSIPVPLAPIDEQQRIVSRIESLFAKLDEAKEKAQEVVDGFETRKAAILHKAFSGELTANWRKDNNKQYLEWNNSPLSLIATVISGFAFSSSDFDSQNTVPCIKITNVGVGEYLSDEYEFLPEDFLREYPKFIVNKGDILISLTRSYINAGLKVCISEETKPSLLNQRVVMIKNCNIRYIYYFLRSDKVLSYVKEKSKTTNQPNLSIKDLNNLMVPIGCPEEQAEIVKLLDCFIAKEQRAKESAEAVIEQIEMMKKAILAYAFRGELGTNNPSEESAVELLKRVLNTASEPKKTAVKRIVIPNSLENRIKTDLEHKIIKLYFQNEVDVLSIDLIMGVSSKKFEIMEALRDLQQRGLIEKQNDKYKLLG